MQAKWDSADNSRSSLREATRMGMVHDGELKMGTYV